MLGPTLTAVVPAVVPSLTHNSGGEGPPERGIAAVQEVERVPHHRVAQDTVDRRDEVGARGGAVARPQVDGSRTEKVSVYEEHPTVCGVRLEGVDRGGDAHWVRPGRGAVTDP